MSLCPLGLIRRAVCLCVARGCVPERAKIVRLSPLPVFVLLFSFVLLFCTEEFAQAKERTELWQGSIYTSTFRCGFCFSESGKARGVLLLKTLYGQVDEYHLYGTITKNFVDVRHSSGHHVTGEILQDGSVRGSITLGTGRTISFKGRRSTDVRLASEDCAPLGD